MSEEDVERLLEAIMLEQETLDLFEEPTPEGGSSENDW
jgi:hypothetical protein